MAAANLHAQSNTAQITGSVSDLRGKAVANATVSAAGELNIVSTISSKEGYFTLPVLLSGEYAVTASAPGLVAPSVVVSVTVGSRVRHNFVLAPQSESNPASASTPALVLNTETQTQSRLVTDQELHNLPDLSRDAYRLAELAGNVSDAGFGTRGVGLAINGLRQSSVGILLDGADNTDAFTSNPGTPVPLDSVREFSVLTGFTAEFGRASGGIIDATGQTGTNRLRGSAYDFNRLSTLSTDTFQDNANGLRQPSYQRNQFGAELGGSIFHHKLYFFVNSEFTIVRSDSAHFAWIVTPQLLAQTSPATQLFFSSMGQLRNGLQIIGTANLSQLAAVFGRSPCLGLVCMALPTALPLLSHVTYKGPGDSGGGFPQNTGNSYNRLDYNLSSRTRLYGRYTIYDEHDQAGLLSSSPYANYDLGQKQVDNSLLLSAIHQWNSRWISQFTAAFDRIDIDQQGLTSRGIVPTMYANPFSPIIIGTDPVAFPGYNPYTPGVGGAFGGPENIAQLAHDTSWTKGRHFIRFGGSYVYIRDNRTDAAYQTAVDSLAGTAGLGPALAGLMFGTFAQIQVAVDPQGQLPCGQTPSCSLRFPLSAPNFSRSNRFQDGALYVQDYWHLSRRISVSAGVRWEHYGVQHNGNSALASNWYAPGASNGSLIDYLVYGGVEPVSKSSIGELYKPDWKDFAPRVGFAWDVFGNGKTSLRAGYGTGYERDFGNVTFNVLQNLPNYAVLNVPGPITTDNFGPLSASSGAIPLPPPSARIIDPNLKTASARTWSATVQREISPGISYSFEYSASRGINLYAVSYPNQAGFRNLVFGDPCLGQGDCETRPNPYYSEDVGYRGNQGFSRYYGLNNRVVVRDLFHSGVFLTATYTWSHAVDNISSTFFESGAGGAVNRYGNGDITVNNGYFDSGLLDPFQPNLDKGDAEFDIRHRVVVSGNWNVPVWKRMRRAGRLLEGWSVDPLFIGRSGEPFSVFDTTAQTLDLSAPRATFLGAVPTSRNSYVAGTTPDTYQIFTFQTAQIAHELNTLTPGQQFPANMSHRDAFRAPGFWNLDIAVTKETVLTEKLSMQLRAEFFNVFNHANLYVIGATADVGVSNTINACYGCSGSTWDRRQVQLAARFRF